VCLKQLEGVLENLKEKNCQCGGIMDQVIRVTRDGKPVTPTRAGWYCPSCKNFDKAVGREIIYKKT
jgi:hypothetical protein